MNRSILPFLAAVAGIAVVFVLLIWAGSFLADVMPQMHSSDVAAFGAFGLALFLCLLLLVWSVWAVWRTRQRAEKAGFRGIGEYLRAAPRTDAEKREAVTMMMRGMVLTLLGIVFAPLALLGVVPLYYGGRKIALALLGLDLPVDADEIA